MSTDEVFERFNLNGWVVSRESLWEDLGLAATPPSLAGDVANARILNRSVAGVTWDEHGFPIYPIVRREDVEAAQAFLEPVPGARAEPPAQLRVALPEGFEPTDRQRAAREAAQEGASVPSFADQMARARDAYEQMAASLAATGPFSNFVFTADDLDWDSDLVTVGYTAGGVVPPGPVEYASGGGWLGVRPVATWVDEASLDAATDNDVACVRFDDTEGGEECACPDCVSRRAEIDKGEAVWLDILSRETEACGSPLEAARRVFGNEGEK